MNGLPFRPECLGGWRSLIEDCHREMLAVDADYSVVQVKEKFGSLRYYYSTSYEPNDPRADELWGIARKYEELSSTVCESCGSHGATNERHEGWWRTRCEACRRTK